MITKAIEGDTKTNNNKTINEDFEADMLNGFPWPPRCYICSFCKREFKSAQALGGHMNIHRKDRARLRSSVPNSHLFNAHYTQNTIPNLNLNPNPSLISSSSSLPFSTRQQLLSPLSTTSFSSMPSWLSPSYHPPPTFLSPSSSYYHTQNLSKRLVGGNPRSLNQSREVKINSKAEEVGSMMRLDLEIGVLGGNSKDDIDLELRLGY